MTLAWGSYPSNPRRDRHLQRESTRVQRPFTPGLTGQRGRYCRLHYGSIPTRYFQGRRTLGAEERLRQAAIIALSLFTPVEPGG